MNRLDIIQNAINWQAEGNDRAVRIDIGSSGKPHEFRVWVYDYSLAFGQFVEDGRTIDLDTAHKQAMKEQLAHLQRQLEGA